jgi:GAF domain-containing protein
MNALLRRSRSDLIAVNSLAAVQAIVRTTARRLVKAQGATFVLREGDVCFYADEDAMSPLWKGHRFPVSQCISGWAMLNRKTAVIGDIRADERIPQAAYSPTFVRSLVMVPIDVDAPVGAIGAYWSYEHVASVNEVRLLETLAADTAVALRRLELSIRGRSSPWRRTASERTA